MSGPFAAVLHRLVDGGSLSRAGMREAMDHLMRGDATAAQTGAFLTALRLRGETPAEIAGAAESMRAHARRFPGGGDPLLDTCGTGGDGGHTFNISTAAAFVVAGAGIRVAKHGNRSVSSRCGSADVLEALGARIDLEPAAAAGVLDATGFTFLFAPHYHPAARHAALPRKELAFRTLFNIIGPLCNPAPLTHQVMGVYAPGLLVPIAEVLGMLGARRAAVVHGDGGLDELSLCGPSRVAEWRDGAVHESVVRPEDLGFAPAPVEALRGGEAETNARIIRAVLEGERGPARDAVALNAAASILVAGAAAGWSGAARAATDSIDGGRALGALEAFVAATRRGGAR